MFFLNKKKWKFELEMSMKKMYALAITIENFIHFISTNLQNNFQIFVILKNVVIIQTTF